MNFVAVYQIYNEAQFLKESLESVRWCDKIVIIDGAYEGFPYTGESAMSSDGTIEIIQEFMKSCIANESDEIWLGTMPRVILITKDTPWVGNSKVERYLQEVDDDDYILRMNGDEIVEFPYVDDRLALEAYIEETTKLPLYTVHTYRPSSNNSKYDWMPRLVKKTPDLHISGKHLVFTNKFTPEYALTGGRNRVTPIAANLPQELISIRHMCDYRDDPRKAQNLEWTRTFNRRMQQ